MSVHKYVLLNCYNTGPMQSHIYSISGSYEAHKYNNQGSLTSTCKTCLCQIKLSRKHTHSTLPHHTLHQVHGSNFCRLINTTNRQITDRKTVTVKVSWLGVKSLIVHVCPLQFRVEVFASLQGSS